MRVRCRQQPIVLMVLLLLARVECAAEVPSADPASPSTPEDLPPAELVLQLREARIAGMEGRRDEALARLRSAAEEHPRSILPLMALWDFHADQQLSEEEEAHLRELLTRRLADSESPLPPGTLRYLVEYADASEDYLAMVLEAVQSRMGEGQAQPRYLEAVAVLQERLGRLPEAREILGRLLSLRPSEELRLHCIALDWELERWSSVAELLRPRITEDTFFLERMIYIEVLAKLGDHEEVLRQLELLGQSPGVKFVRVEGFLDDHLLQVAWNLRDAGRGDAAERIFRRVLEIAPEQVEARNAILHLYSSDAERLAHAATLKQRWREEDDPELLSREGASMLAAGDAERAFDLLARAVEGLPDSEIAWFNLGLAASRLRNWTVADRAMARAIEIQPARAESHLYRGAALQGLDRCGEAIALLEEALALDPALTQAHYYLHVCYHALGRYEDSQEQLRLYNESRQSGSE